MVNIKFNLFIPSLCSLPVFGYTSPFALRLALILFAQLHFRANIPFAGNFVIIFLHVDELISRMLLLKVFLHVLTIFRPQGQLFELFATRLSVAHGLLRLNQVARRDIGLAAFRIFAKISD